MNVVFVQFSSDIIREAALTAQWGGARSPRENEAASKCFSPQMAQLHFVFAQPKLISHRSPACHLYR